MKLYGLSEKLNPNFENINNQYFKKLKNNNLKKFIYDRKQNFLNL